ncbi:hypothetical protein V7S43_013424 [Phytophthora oleae]|uniref:Uncharacterized protein n=1 Tax=Phytophthora oleae TaxID=2107226 RepID=A0ABD3F4B0_9STRA
MLIGQEVNLLGRRFKVKHQSPLANKFFLDVFGVRSTMVANTGKSRGTYLRFLEAEIEKQTPEFKGQWETLRLLSAFKLLVHTMCPFITGSSA